MEKRPLERIESRNNWTNNWISMSFCICLFPFVANSPSSFWRILLFYFFPSVCSLVSFFVFSPPLLLFCRKITAILSSVWILSLILYSGYEPMKLLGLLAFFFFFKFEKKNYFRRFEFESSKKKKKNAFCLWKIPLLIPKNFTSFFSGAIFFCCRFHFPLFSGHFSSCLCAFLPKGIRLQWEKHRKVCCLFFRRHFHPESKQTDMSGTPLGLLMRVERKNAGGIVIRIFFRTVRKKARRRRGGEKTKKETSEQTEGKK